MRRVRSLMESPRVESHCPEASRKFFLEALDRAPDLARGEAWDDTHAFEGSGEEPISNPLWVADPSRPVARRRDLARPKPPAPSPSLPKPCCTRGHLCARPERRSPTEFDLGNFGEPRGIRSHRWFGCSMLYRSTMISSTRRFSSRPRAVRLGAIGRPSPNPTASRRPG